MFEEKVIFHSSSDLNIYKRLFWRFLCIFAILWRVIAPFSIFSVNFITDLVLQGSLVNIISLRDTFYSSFFLQKKKCITSFPLPPVFYIFLVDKQEKCFFFFKIKSQDFPFYIRLFLISYKNTKNNS